MAHHPNLSHHAFPQPTDPSVRVWRYLNLAKYISLLTHKSLYLCRLDLLGDPYEGSVPKNTRPIVTEGILKSFGVTRQDKMGADIVRLFGEEASVRQRRLRRWLHVNCWRYGNDESEAMWRLYCGARDEGIAITLAYSALASSVVGENRYIGCVTYRNYEDDVMPPGNFLFPCMSKRIAFLHESEVRIVDTRELAHGLDADANAESAAGLELPWDPKAHVERVFVSPYARRWFHEVVREVTSALAPPLADRVTESGMAAEPVF